MKKLNLLFCIMLCFFIMPLSVDAAKVKMNQSSLTMTKKESYQLTVSGLTAKQKKSVKWSSNKTSVATVSSTGKVTAKASGTATVTAKYGNKKYTCKVTVITFNKTASTLEKKGTLTLSVSGLTAKQKKAVKWSSNKTSVATVSSAGKVTAKTSGTATITAKYGTKKLTCKVTVKVPAASNKTVTVYETKTSQIKATVGVIKTAKSSNTKVATVTAAGKITGKSSGNATITVTTKLGNSFKVTVKVNHSYQAKVVKPTCLEKGYTKHTCQYCKKVYKDTYVAALGHAFGDWKMTAGKAPDCVNEGERTRSCTRCDEIETEEVAPLGHDYQSKTVAATCTSDGYTLHTCSRCQDTYKDQAVQATGHLYKDEVVAPTCTTKGYTKHTCQTCGISYTDKETEALGHDLGKWEEKTAADCQNEGRETRSCSRCDYQETRTVEKLSHQYESVVIDPTCEEGGYTRHTCTICGAYYDDQQTEALGHDFGEWVLTKNPTTTTPGTEVQTCSRCGTENTRETTCTEHQFSLTGTQQATCTEEGYNIYTCDICGLIEHRNVVPSTDHTWDDGLYVMATCSEYGYDLYTCEVCGAEKTVVDEESGLAAHDWIDSKVLTEANCQTEGVKEQKCRECGQTQTVSIPKTDHQTKEVVVSESWCEESGIQGITEVVCEVCGEVINTKATPYRDHSYQVIDTIDATCETDGYTLSQCVYCDKKTKTDVRKATGHSWLPEVITSEASCEQDGESSRLCSVCFKMETTVTPATGHDYVSQGVLQEATCTVDGKESFRCKNCQKETTKTIKATGHQGTYVGGTEYIHQMKCDICGESYAGVCEYTHETVAATCTEDGYERDVCTICGSTANQATTESALGHDYHYVEGNESTAYKHVTTCFRCGKKNDEAHTYTDFVITKQPSETMATCEEDFGSRERHCTACGYQDINVIVTVGIDPYGGTKTMYGYFGNQEDYDAALDATNAYRAETGAAPVRWEKEVEFIAKLRSVEMANYFRHGSLTDEDPLGGNSAWVEKYTKNRSGENIAAGGDDMTALAAVHSFRESPGHYSQMIWPDHEGMAIAVFYPVDEETGTRGKGFEYESYSSQTFWWPYGNGKVTYDEPAAENIEEEENTTSVEEVENTLPTQEEENSNITTEQVPETTETAETTEIEENVENESSTENIENTDNQEELTEDNVN